MFYHVIINGKKKNTKDTEKVYSELDITDKDYLIESIVIPYIQNEKLMVDGAFLFQADVDTLKIYTTNINSTVFHKQKRAEWDSENSTSGVFFVSVSDEKDDIRWYGEDITRQIITEANTLIKHQRNNTPTENTISLDNKRVFIVHGHDSEMKIAVARLLEHLGLEAIILHEQANKGQTIIEKFEKNSNVGFAVILYSPCDIGGKKDDPKQRPRARQNVVLEHGYFIGKLGRERVLALYRDEVELASDLQGILYTLYDSSDSWKYALANEMKTVGYDIDKNKIK